MKEYLDLVKYVMENGERKVNRTGVETISCFAYHYKVDPKKGFPLLTTKKVNFNALLHELLWYLTGDDHIRDLRTKTKIWDDWADVDGNLETAYGRFWRRFPVPRPDYMPEHEAWATRPESDAHRWIRKTGYREYEFDQIQYVYDTLIEMHDNPELRNGRRLIVSAWNPANATASKLPPCHFSFVFNVINGKLNLHLTQRSADIALGVPFNLACYAMILEVFAKLTGWEVGEFSHLLVDAHIYVDQIEGLQEQLKREPKELPKLIISDRVKDINDLTFEDFKLEGYDPAPIIKFPVAV